MSTRQASRTKQKNSLSRSKRNELISKVTVCQTTLDHERSTAACSKEKGITYLKDKALLDEVSMRQNDTPNDVKGSSHLDTSKEDLEIDDLAGLKFCSQDNGLNTSYDDDTQCEVRWDCCSPETVKQLKKLRGQYTAEGVKRIVANFNDAHVKPKEWSTLRPIPLPGPGPSAPFKEVSFPERSKASNKRPQRAKNRKAVQEMIQLLQGKVAKQKDETEVAKLSSEEVSSFGIREDANNNKETDTNKAADNDDCWSDDDLFQDNSFLIEATQNPEKFMNTSVDVSSTSKSAVNLETGKSEDERSRQSDSSTSSIIPSSYAPNQQCVFHKPLATSTFIAHQKKVGIQSTKPSYGTNVEKTPTLSKQRNGHWGIDSLPPGQPYKSTHSTSTSHLSNTQQSKPYSAYSAKLSSSVNKFANQSSRTHTPQSSQHIMKNSHTRTQTPQSSQQIIKNSHSRTQDSQPHITHLPPGAKVKTSFRKFKSFQVSSSDMILKKDNPTGSKQSPNATLNNSFKRAMSFDSSSCSPSISINATVIKSNPANNNSSKCSHLNETLLQQRDFIPSATKQFPLNSAPIAQKNCNKAAMFRSEGIVSAASADDGFDISLSDDILQQLLEVDEMFDSQADIMATGKPAAAPSIKSIKEPSFSSTCSTSPTDSLGGMNGLKPKSTLTTAHVNSLRSSTPVRPFKQRGSLLEPKSSTPAKLARPSDRSTKDSSASDSGLEFFDSFLNEEMYETQMLPILEKIEAESESKCGEVQHSDEVAPCVHQITSPVKCSPEEIEQKRQAALQRRSLRLSQMKSNSSQR